MGNETKRAPRQPLQPINGAVGSAASAQRQGYTGIDGGWDGVPVSGINPQGQRVPFINGRSPEDHALWQSQQQGPGAATPGTGQAGNNTAASQSAPSAGQTNAASARPSISRQFAALPNDVAMTVNQASGSAPAAPASGQRPRIADSFQPAPAAAPYASGGNFNTQQATNDFATGKITAAQRDQVYSAASRATDTQGGGISPATQAADAAYQRQNPGPPSAAQGGYGALPAIPGQTQVAPTDGGSLVMFGANGPQTIAPGASVTSLPGNKTIIGGRGFQTQVQSGAGAANPTQEASRTVDANGTTHIVTASGARVDAPAGTPVAGGGATGADTGMVGASGQQIVRSAQGQLAPGTTPSAPAAPVSAAPSAMAAAGTPTLPATSFGPVPTSSQPQPLQADPNAFSGQPLALNTGTGTPNTTGQRISQSFATRSLPDTPQMAVSDFAAPASGAGPSSGTQAALGVRSAVGNAASAVSNFSNAADTAFMRSADNTGDFVRGLFGIDSSSAPSTPAAPAAPSANAAATGSLAGATPAVPASPSGTSTASTAAQTLANAPGYGADPASQSAQPAPLGKSALYQPGQASASSGAAAPGSGTAVNTPPTTTATTPAGSTTFDTANPLASPIKLDLNGTSPQRPRIADSFPPANDQGAAAGSTPTASTPAGSGVSPQAGSTDAARTLANAPTAAQALAAAPGFGASPGTDAAVPASPGKPALAPTPGGPLAGTQGPAPEDQDQDELRRRQAAQAPQRPQIAAMFA